MLTGVSKEKAIKALCNGKQVLVCDRSIRNGKVIPMVSLDNYLDGLDFLMDVPAVLNPEFEEAVQSMVDSGETKEESEKQEEVIPPPIKPESEMIPAEKSKKEIVLELAEQGLTAPEIAKKTGIKYNTVYFYMNPEKCKKKPSKPERVERKPGWNKDRHACKMCQYRAAQADKAKGIGCMYSLIENHSRGCDVEDCVVYVRGKRISLNEEKHGG